MVKSGIRLNDYATTPLYNIKAVVQATNISPSTLRAWERRYNVCNPQRSESGYRLYSDRDIALIRWLKAQVDNGMSISQAVTWYETIISKSNGSGAPVLPVSSEEMRSSVDGRGNQQTGPKIQRSNLRDFASLQHDLLESLLVYDESRADQVMTEAISYYSLEEVGDSLLTPVLVEVGERWHRGELNITKEHYITNYLRQRLTAMLRSIANGSSREVIWIGCAPGEYHEIGTLLLCIYLRRAGYQVHFLGQNLHAGDLIEEIQQSQPDILLLSATTHKSAQELSNLTSQLTSLNIPRLLIGYGGQIFRDKPELRSTIAGVYFGATAQEAIEIIGDLLHGRAS